MGPVTSSVGTRPNSLFIPRPKAAKPHRQGSLPFVLTRCVAATEAAAASRIYSEPTSFIGHDLEEVPPNIEPLGDPRPIPSMTASRIPVTASYIQNKATDEGGSLRLRGGVEDTDAFTHRLLVFLGVTNFLEACVNCIDARDGCLCPRRDEIGA